MENNGIINGNGTNDVKTTSKVKDGAKGFLNGLRRKYDAIRYSKAGKWVARGITALALVGTGKVAYDKGVAKGKASVPPTVVTIEPIPAEETAEEAPAEEEKTEVETAE